MKLIISILFMFNFAQAAELIQPKTNKEFKQTSVRVYNLALTGGGTGSIYRSFKSGSHILTNKHVCRVIEQGGYVVTSKKKKYIITHYKKFPHHDLCLVRVAADLGVNTQIANGIAKATQTAYVSGHPRLLPHIVTKGHLTDHMNINLMTGIRDCVKGDDALTCAFFGGFPVIKEFSSQVTSNLIQPGSSGSAVFNSDGDIVGVAFAGSGPLSYGFIVPHISVAFFISNTKRFKWVKTGTEVDDEGLRGRIFNFKSCETAIIKTDKIEEICRNVKRNLLWNIK